MNTFWILILLFDDGSGTFQMSQQYSQYYTQNECVAERDQINQNMTNIRAECYALSASKVK